MMVKNQPINTNTLSYDALATQNLSLKSSCIENEWVIFIEYCQTDQEKTNYILPSTQRGGQFACCYAGSTYLNKMCYVMKRNTVYPLSFFCGPRDAPSFDISTSREKCSEPHIHLCYINVYSPTPAV